MLPPGPVLHVAIRAQKRHQTGTAWRRQTDGRWQSLLNRQISASLLSLHQMQWSTRRGAARRARWRTDRIRSSGRGRIRGERADRDSAFCPARGTVLRVFIWCPLLFRVCTHLSAHAVKPRASPCSLWENCRKQTRLPSSSARPFPRSSSSSLRPSLVLLSTLNYISVVVCRNWNKQ